MARGLLVVTLLALVTLASVPVPATDAPDDARYLALRGDISAAGALPVGTVSNGAEPDIHVTRDGTTILVGDWTGLYRSLNGGQSWFPANDPFLPGVFADGWAIAEDDVGRIYVSTTQGQVVGVASSANNGQTWDITSEVVAVGSIVDRPWLAARGDGEVALVVFSNTGEECYRSTDGGATWLERSLVNTGDPNAGSLSFDSRGRIWYSNGDSWFRWSPCLMAPLTIDHPNAGAQILTQAALDAQDRPYTAVPTGNNGQMVVHSAAPGGAAKTVAVSLPAQKSNTFGAIAIDKDTGDIAVGWYGSTTAGDPSSNSFNGDWHVFVARIQDFWSTTPTISVEQITPANTPNHVGGFCMSGIACTGGTADRDLLDYQGVDIAPDGSIHIAYGHDGATSNAQVRYAKATV